MGLAKHIALNIQLESGDGDKSKKSKQSIDQTKFLKYIPNNWCKNVSDEVSWNISFGNKNIIPDVIIEDDKKSIKNVKIKVFRDKKIIKIKVNNIVLISVIKQNLQNHLNVPSSMIVLFYNNTELLDDKTVLSYSIEKIIHLNVKCNNSKHFVQSESVNDETNNDK